MRFVFGTKCNPGRTLTAMAISLCYPPVFIICLLAFLSGCATSPYAATASPVRHRPSVSIPLNLYALEKYRFVEITRVNHKVAHVTYLRLWPRGGPKSPGLVCRQRGISPHHPVAVGAWVWRSRELVRRPNLAAAFLRRAQAHGITTINLQWQRGLSGFAAFLKRAYTHGIRVNALAGQPSDVLDPTIPLQILHSVLRYNRFHRYRFAGLQLDIEPYLLKGYTSHRTAILAKYVRLLGAIHAAAAHRLDFSIVVPFWFADIRLHGRDLMALIAQRVDRIAIMSYRTHLAALLRVANNALCYGARYGKPVTLGLEVSKLPTVTHDIIPSARLLSIAYRTSEHIVPGHIVLAAYPGLLRPIAVRHWIVNPTDLSFYPHTGAAFLMTRADIPYASFAGWEIEGLDRAWIQPSH